MANEYVTAAELKATLSLSTESYADADIELAVTAASRGVDGATGRRFWQDADANQLRYYTPLGKGRLDVDDIVVLTWLKTDSDGDGTFEETWTATDYVLEPLNAVEDSRPYEVIRQNPSGDFRFPCGPRSVEVKARFGWSAVPESVKTATSMLATRLLRRMREAPFGVVNLSLEGEAVRISSTDPDVRFLLSSYVKANG